MTGRGFSCVLASLAVMAARTPLARPDCAWLGRIVPGKVGFHLISSESWAPIRRHCWQLARNERHGQSIAAGCGQGRGSTARYLGMVQHNTCQPARCSSNFSPGTAAWRCPDVLATWNKGGPARSWRRRPGLHGSDRGKEAFPGASPSARGPSANEQPPPRRPQSPASHAPPLIHPLTHYNIEPGIDKRRGAPFQPVDTPGDRPTCLPSLVQTILARKSAVCGRNIERGTAFEFDWAPTRPACLLPT